MSRPLFVHVGSNLQVTWWTLGQWKGRKNAANDNYICLLSIRATHTTNNTLLTIQYLQYALLTLLMILYSTYN